MYNLVILFCSLISITVAEPFAQWGYGGPASHSNHGHGAVITATSEPESGHIHEIIPKEGGNIYHSSYKAPDYSHHVPSQEWDTIFNKKHDTGVKLNKHDEEKLRKAYNEYLDNKIALKKRIFTTLVQKTVDKTVDVTASLTKYAVDFLTKLSIDTAAKVAKTGAHAVLHKKEEKFKNKYHH